MNYLKLLAVGAFALAACDESSGVDPLDAAGAVADASPGQERDTGGLPKDAADAPDETGPVTCNPRVTNFPIVPTFHIVAAEYNAASYNSNPPSSGQHCGLWGQHAEFTSVPLPRCNWLHNLEHGAVALLHNCPGGCSDVTNSFKNLVKAFMGDPGCKPPRFVITADPTLATKVAAAAWGWTFTADCLDANALQILSAFINTHYGQGPEAVCASGQIAP